MPRIDCDLHHLNQKTKIPMDTIIIFTLQILKALKYIHSAKVLHRDLKPQNILVTLATLQIVVCVMNEGKDFFLNSELAQNENGVLVSFDFRQY